MQILPQRDWPTRRHDYVTEFRWPCPAIFRRAGRIASEHVEGNIWAAPVPQHVLEPARGAGSSLDESLAVNWEPHVRKPGSTLLERGSTEFLCRVALMPNTEYHVVCDCRRNLLIAAAVFRTNPLNARMPINPRIIQQYVSVGSPSSGRNCNIHERTAAFPSGRQTAS